jgi:hypothetical protein
MSKLNNNSMNRVQIPRDVLKYFAIIVERKNKNS